MCRLKKDGHDVRKLPTKSDVIDHTPIMIGDAADNPSGGAGGAGTHLLGFYGDQRLVESRFHIQARSENAYLLLA